MYCSKTSLAPLALAVATATTPLVLHAQNNPDSEWNHFGIDFRLGLNIKAKFSNIGASPALSAPPGGGGVDHNYSDGFVRVDSSGDQGGATWNWGYQNASQVSANGTLSMHSASSITGASVVNENPRLGFEATYSRDLGHFSWGRWGLKIAFGYTDLNIHDSKTLNGNVSLITDSYALNGITPPLAPYSGSFGGPGPVIGDTPTRTITSTAGGALIQGSRQLEATLYDLRLGPNLELPLFGALSCQASGGLAAGLTDSTFSFSENVNSAGGSVQTAGSNHRLSSLVGFYAEAGLAYRLVPQASFFAGGQFQYLGDFNQSAEGRNVQLDLKRSVYFVAGLQWHF